MNLNNLEWAKCRLEGVGIVDPVVCERIIALASDLAKVTYDPISVWFVNLVEQIVARTTVRTIDNWGRDR